MPDSQLQRYAAIHILCRHLGIGVIRLGGGSGTYETTWEWRGGEQVHILIGARRGWTVTARAGLASVRMAEVRDPLGSPSGPTAADILAVCRTARVIPPVDTTTDLRPAEHLACDTAWDQFTRGVNPGINTTGMLLLTIQRLTGHSDYLMEDGNHGT